jgi:hypothetical protein
VVTRQSQARRTFWAWVRWVAIFAATGVLAYVVARWVFGWSHGTRGWVTIGCPVFVTTAFDGLYRGPGWALHLRREGR